MKNKLIRVLAATAFLATANTAAGQKLGLVGGNEYNAGEAVSITYDAAPTGSQIAVYHNLSMLPLKDKCKIKQSSGTFTLDALQPGSYKAILSENGVELASASFTVDQYAIPAGGKHIVLLSDIHVLAPELIEDPTNSSFKYAMSSDRKLIEQSYEIFCAYIDTIKAMKPDLLLIPGDLTKDGELASHQAVAAKLHELLDAGIPTLVIPGNHDMENNSARLYTSSGAQTATTIMPDDFAEIYASFGYTGTDRDPYSLSYACEPLEGIRLICIDDCRTPSRGDTQWGDGEFGRIHQPTIDWILEQADQAKADGKVAIAAVHHQMLQHYVGQDSLMTSAATERGDSIARLMADHGIKVVLTGHMHIPNITRVSGFETTDTITEITSASTISYPSQYRILWIDDANTEMKVYSHNLASTPNISNLQQLAKDKIDGTLNKSMSSLASRYISTFQKMLKDFAEIPEFANVIDDVPEDPNELAAIAVEAFGQVIREVIYTTSEGNEHLKNASDEVLSHLEDGCKAACDIVFDQQSEQSKAFLAYSMYVYMLELGEQSIISMLSDTSYLGTDDANQTDDLYTTILLKDADDGISTAETVIGSSSPAIYSISGQRLNNGSQTHGIYIIKKGHEVKKVLR